jgi:hypothetical protein
MCIITIGDVLAREARIPPFLSIGTVFEKGGLVMLKRSRR